MESDTAGKAATIVHWKTSYKILLMAILQLPSKPPRTSDTPKDGSEPDAAQAGEGNIPPAKLRTNRFGDLEEHELIHLIDALDDERSRARFRESIYISMLVWIAISWFVIYGPRVLFHQPVLRDPIALMKQHDKEQLTYINTPPLPPARPPVLNQKTMQRIQRQAQPTPPPPAPQPPLPAAPAPQPEVAHNAAPPIQQPAIPLPSAPHAAPSVDLPAAPHPAIASNAESAHSAMQDAMRNALHGRSGADVGAPGATGSPLQAGAQILSDIGDWDPSAYMRRLHNDIQRNWDPLIPEEVQPPLSKKGITGIRFIILRDGQVGDIKLETPSGDVALDKAAWYAITSEGQFPVLPKEYHGQQLELRVGFFYNEPIRQ
jgi:outer membrane biosynthesis protein TonB